MEETNFEFHYDKATVQITALSHFENTETFFYTPVLFSEDWIKDKKIDWVSYLATLLERTTDCMVMFEDLLKLPFQKTEDNPFFEPLSIPHSQINVSSDEQLLKKYKDWSFVIENFDRLKEFQKMIVECQKFFEKNKNLPPFSEKYLLTEKIPFWGHQLEFQLFVYLLLESDFILAKKRGSRKFPFEIKSELKSQFEAFSSMEKQGVIRLFSDYFKGINLENNKIEEISFKPVTISKKTNDIELSKLGTKEFEFFENRLNEMLTILSKIKKMKEPPSVFRERST